MSNHTFYMNLVDQKRNVKTFLNDRNLIDFKSARLGGLYSAMLEGISFTVIFDFLIERGLKM